MSWRGANGLYVVRKLGLTANLIYCLDPGDAASYGGSGQTIADLSGNSNTFNLGATSGSEASDPTFSGTAGRVSLGEYLGLDGSQYLTVASMPAALQTFHKDNAVGTIAGWFYYVGSASGQAFFGSATSGSTGLGVKLIAASGGGLLRFQGGNGAGASIINANLGISLDSAVGTSLWIFIAVAFDEAGNSILARANGVTSSSAFTYSSPSASDVGAFHIGAVRSAGIPLLNGSRVGPQLALSRQLSAGELAALFDATRGRFQV